MSPPGDPGTEPADSDRAALAASTAAPPRPVAAAIIPLEIPVYTFDIDFAGVVSNIVYLRWSEMWRLELLRRTGLSVEEMMRGGIVPYMVRQELNYRRPMRLGAVARLEGWVERVGRSSVTMWLEVRNGRTGELCCENRQVMVMVDGKTGASTEIPAETRKLLEKCTARL